MLNKDELARVFRKIIIENELGGNMKYVLEFSDPDGVRSGKSGWSFGASQFDIANNAGASACLRECGFNEQEISGLKAQTIDVKPLEAKLRSHPDVIERYDEAQFSWCLDHAQNLLMQNKAVEADTTAFLAVADMANQYSPATTNKMVVHLAGLGRPFLAKDVLDYKLTSTNYGKTNPGDCKRRYMNILRIVQNG
jgi:hypothetical protein